MSMPQNGTSVNIATQQIQQISVKSNLRNVNIKNMLTFFLYIKFSFNDLPNCQLFPLIYHLTIYIIRQKFNSLGSQSKSQTNVSQDLKCQEMTR